MKVTLAKANKIRNYLEDRILPKLQQEVIEHRTVTFVGFEDETLIETKFSEEVGEITSLISSFESVSDIAHRIRDKICVVNQKKLNQVISQIASMKRKLEFYNRALSFQANSDVSPKEIASTLDFANKKQENGLGAYYGNHANQKTYFVHRNGVLNKEMIDSRILEIETAIRNLEEDRNALNYSTMVDLEDDIVTALAPYKII